MSEVIIRVNDREVITESGKSLLLAIMDAGIPIDTACGGAARCHLCRVTITDGRDGLCAANPVEYKALGNVLIAQGMRLACQVEVSQPLTVTVPEPRPKRRRGPPPPRPRAEPPKKRERVHETSPPSTQPSPPPSPSSETPDKKKKRRRRRRPRRRRNESEGT